LTTSSGSRATATQSRILITPDRRDIPRPDVWAAWKPLVMNHFFRSLPYSLQTTVSTFSVNQVERVFWFSYGTETRIFRAL
jgi:hypothetical protein